MGVTYKAKAHLKTPFDPENKRVKGIYAWEGRTTLWVETVAERGVAVLIFTYSIPLVISEVRTWSTVLENKSILKLYSGPTGSLSQITVTDVCADNND